MGRAGVLLSLHKYIFPPYKYLLKKTKRLYDLAIPSPWVKPGQKEAKVVKQNGVKLDVTLETPEEVESPELHFTFTESSNDTDDGTTYETPCKKIRIE